MVLISTRPLTGKALLLRDLTTDKNIDMLLLTQKWQANKDFMEMNICSILWVVATCLNLIKQTEVVTRLW